VQTLRIARPELGKDLDSHVALQGRVAGAIDLTHATRAQWDDESSRVPAPSDLRGADYTVSIRFKIWVISQPKAIEIIRHPHRTLSDSERATRAEEEPKG
jgi:hypothetical protein